MRSRLNIICGIAKDNGGIPVIGVDVNMLSKAQEDPTSPEASLISNLEQAAANLHAGDKTYIITPLDYDDSGKPLYSFELKGITGGGKQYDSNAVIQRKQNEILWIYLADVLKLGTDSHGSFSLADSKNALLAFAIEHHLQLIADVINEDLVKQTLEINGIFLEDEFIPKITYGDLDEVDFDNFSKLIQRLSSVGMLPRTLETVNEILEKSGFKHRLTQEDLDKESELDSNVLSNELFPNSESKSGEGNETPFEGTSKGGGTSGDKSVSNSENT